MTRLLRLLAVGAAAMLCSATLPSVAHAGDQRPRDADDRRERMDTHGVDPNLMRARDSGGRDLRYDDRGRVLVVVEGEAGEVSRAVEAAGGRVTGGSPTKVEAGVPPARLEEVGEAEGVKVVREPHWFQPAAESEGVLGTNASDWHLKDKKGAGIEIAIVDGGFGGYATKLGTELPATVETTSHCPDGGMGTDPHGTAVAEIVHDMAPAASLHLICIDTDADMAAVGNLLVAQGIRIANMSGGFILTGRGDGSGDATTPAGVVRTSRLNGVLWTVSSGNLGHNHFDFSGTDRDGDRKMEFDGSAVAFQPPTARPDDSELQRFYVDAGGQAQVSLRWDAWPTTTTEDYDLYIWDLSAVPPVEVDASTLPQSPPGAAPVEMSIITNASGSPRIYGAEIWKDNGSVTPSFDLFVSGAADIVDREDRTTKTRSITEPATSPYAMAVGAHCYASGGLEFFSGQGPTIDGRIKPDLTGPDGVSSSVYGDASGCGATGFVGTSASAPHVAGAAAIYLGANPSLDVAELQRLLEVRAFDVGAAGRDPQFGAGRLELRDPDADPPTAPTGALYTGLPAPVRIVETRASQGCVGPKCGFLGTGQSFPFDADALDQVPDGATAVVLNVTAVATTRTGFLTLYPTGSTRPVASSLNFGPGQTLSNHVTATLGSDGGFHVYNHFGETHVVIDLIGYYAPVGGEGFSAISPVRAVETRSSAPSGCIGPQCGAVGSGQTIELPVRGATIGGVTIPPAATAVALNVTAVEPTANSFITVWPGAEPRPTASSLNFPAGSVVPNLVISGIGANGNVNLYHFFGSSHVVVDVLGYYLPGGARYVALDPPTRTLDSRTGTGLRLGALAGFEELPHQVGRLNGVPMNAVGALFNVTVVSPASSGFLTVWPDGVTRPTASSNLNFGPGAVVSNGVLTALGSGGRIRVYNHGSSAATPVLADLSGYFVAG